MSKEEIFVLEINDKYHYFETYKETKEFFEQKLRRKISEKLMNDIFDEDKYFYLPVSTNKNAEYI